MKWMESLRIDDTFFIYSERQWSRWISIGCWKKILSGILVREREKKRTLSDIIKPHLVFTSDVGRHQRPNPNETWSECIELRSAINGATVPSDESNFLLLIMCPSIRCVAFAITAITTQFKLDSNKLSMRLEYISVVKLGCFGRSVAHMFLAAISANVLVFCWRYQSIKPEIMSGIFVKFEPIPWKASNPIDRFHFEQMIEWRKSNKNHTKSDRIKSKRNERNTFTTLPMMMTMTTTATMKWKEN